MTLIATALFLAGIAGLFWLEQGWKDRTSSALWLPVAWLLIAGSRPVSTWFQQGLDPSASFQDGSPIDRTIYLVLLLAGIIVLSVRGRTVGGILRTNWPILLFLIYCALSVVWSDYPDVAFKRWIKSIGDLVMVLIVLTEVNRKGAIKRVLARAGFLLLPLSILLIKYYPDLGRAYSRWEGTTVYLGVATDKNMLGMTCMILGIAASWRFVQEFKGARRLKIFIVHGTIVVMALWLIRTANSMTSLSCLVFGAGLIAATSSRKLARTPTRVHLMVAVVLLVSSSILFLNLGGNVLSAMGRNSTLTGRTELWEQLIRIDHTPILGAGFESFWSPDRVDQLFQVLQWSPNEAHNGYLEIYLNLGWAGIFLLGIVLITGYRTVFRALRQDPEVGRLKLAYFVVGAAYSFTEAGFRMLTPVWITFLWALVMVSSKSAPKMSSGISANSTNKDGIPASKEEVATVSS